VIKETKSRTAAPKTNEESKKIKEKDERKNMMIMGNTFEICDKQTIISAYDK
jgi:hypothetical protein